ncbi:MAG: zinc-dependent metalloprotease [Acidimicrobiia bacterium]|nr:zinc-dependent metalloprotease [Acidimicrobiia bacterium]
MSDNLFDRLFELLNTPGPVNWRLGREITQSLAGAAEPIEPRLAEEYQELTLAAQLRLADRLSLDVSTTKPIHPVDRHTWAEENEQSFRYLIEPLADKFAGLQGGAALAGPFLGQMAPVILGVQAGTMIGFMSHRVLGQFDTGLPALDHDNLYLVIPNVEGFARDHDIESHQIRMWAALREVTNHAILDVDWVRGFFVDAIAAFYATVEFDPSGLMDMLSGLQDPTKLQDPAALEGLVDEPGGLARMLGSSHDPEALIPIQAFMAFVEGFGDYAVRTAAADLMPELAKIEDAVTLRRSEPNEAEQFLQQLLGLRIDRHRAGDAADFCAEVERRWGRETLHRLWEDPDKLPRLEELTDPVGWAARVLLD